MGIYTEFHFNVELNEDINTESNIVIQTLMFMLNQSIESNNPLMVSYHPFFKTPRWKNLLISDSYYFPSDTHSTLRFDNISYQYYLNIKSNIKNYNYEIQKFVDWIMPYLNHDVGEFLGFYRLEETNIPTLIYSYEGHIDRLNYTICPECNIPMIGKPVDEMP